MNSDYVQFGCGLSAPLSWRNFDNSPTLRLQRLAIVGQMFRSKRFPQWPGNVEYGDVVTGLPVQPNSVKAIYCSHVLEHLALNDFRRALGHIHSYLIQGGFFRLVVPDLEYLSRNYLASTDAEAAHSFMQSTLLGYPNRTRGLEGLARNVFGNSHHLWMWDYKSIASELEKAGFHQVRRAQYHDSSEPQYVDVEELGRWENNLGVECIK